MVNVNLFASHQDFTAAMMIPAAASALKQVQREAESELHILADYARSNSQFSGSRDLNPAEEEAISSFGRIIVEQGLTNSGFFLAVKAVVGLYGVNAGMLAQVLITLNTMLNPKQHQNFNPARKFFELIGSRPNWVDLLSPSQKQTFAHMTGEYALKIGYGGNYVDGSTALLLTTRRQGVNWDKYLDGAGENIPRYDKNQDW